MRLNQLVSNVLLKNINDLRFFLFVVSSSIMEIWLALIHENCLDFRSVFTFIFHLGTFVRTSVSTKKMFSVHSTVAVTRLLSNLYNSRYIFYFIHVLVNISFPIQEKFKNLYPSRSVHKTLTIYIFQAVKMNHLADFPNFIHFTLHRSK